MSESPVVQLETVPAARPAGDHGGFSLRDGLTVLFKRWRLATALFVTIVGGVTAYCFLVPPVYECKASLLVKRGRADVPVAPKESPLLLINEVREEDLNTEIFILQSPELLTDVVIALRDEGAWPTPSLPGIGVEETVLHLQNSLDIEALTGSNIIEIAYRSPDRKWATEVVSTLTERYLDRRSEVYQSPKAVSFFQDQEADARTRLEQAEHALQDFLQDARLTMVKGPQGAESLAAQKQVLIDRIAELQGRSENASADLAECKREIEALEAKLAETPERLPSSNRMMLDANIEELQRGLVELQLKRDQLTQVYAPQNAKVRDVNQQIDLLQKRLVAAQHDAGEMSQTEPNPLYRDLKGKLTLAQADYERLRARAGSASSLIAAHRERLAQLNQQGITLERLERDVTSAEESFLLYQRKHEEARISTAMDQERIVNVSIAQPARMPAKPASPRKKRNVGLALVVGTIVAIGAAFVRERLSPTLTTGHDLQQHLGVVELASIPESR